LLTQESDAESGLVSLSLALMLDPKLDAALISIAEAQRDLGNGDAARATLAKLPATSPYAESARLMAAWTLRQEGREDDAITAARTAAADGGPRAQLALADLYRSFDRYAEAEPLYTHLIDSGAAEWRLYFARGAVRERLGRWPEGEADLQRALQISPEQPEVMNYLGYTWVDRGEHLTAGLQMLQRAVALRPQSGAVLDSLGWAYYRLGRYNEALEYLERAVELEPSDPTLMDHLGDNYWRVGRRLEARFQWRRVLTLTDTSADLKTVVERKIEAGLPASTAADAR
jgi:Flp pilus assembly protein TadD